MVHPKDILYSQRDDNGLEFDEQILTPVSGTFVVCNDCDALSTLALVEGSNISFTRTILSGQESLIISLTGAGSGSIVLSSSVSLTTGSLYPITASWAISSSWSETASFSINGGGSGTTLTTGSLYPITSSWAISASWSETASFALNGGATIDTGSFVLTSSFNSWTGSNISVFSGTSSFAISASYPLPSGGTSLTTGSTYPITSSWAITASLALGMQNVGASISRSFYELQVQSVKMPFQSSSLLDANPQNWALYFNNGTAGFWQFRMPSNYGDNLKNTFQFYMTGSQGPTASLVWRVSLFTTTPGDQTNVSSSGATLVVSITQSLSSSIAAGYLVEQSISLTGSAHSIAAGDFILYKLERVANSGSNVVDTATGSVALVSNMLDWSVA